MLPLAEAQALGEADGVTVKDVVAVVVEERQAEAEPVAPPELVAVTELQPDALPLSARQ